MALFNYMIAKFYVNYFYNSNTKCFIKQFPIGNLYCVDYTLEYRYFKFGMLS